MGSSSSTPRAGGRRLAWQQVPAHVRTAVEAALGAAVVEAVTQEGGFSPGAAARLRLANGRRAFVKALGVDVHRPSVGLYRSEAASMPHLPAGLPVPRLLDVYDDGEWVALVYEEVDGRHPVVPWRSDELERVAGAMADLTAALQPSPWPGAPAYADVYGAILGAWRELGHHPDLTPWMRQRLDRLAAQEIDLAEAVRGDSLLHTDIRSDNLLLTPHGGVVFLDWAWTCNGAPWLDLVLFALTVNLEGGADAELLVRGHPLTRSLPPNWIDAILLDAVAHYFRQLRLPEPESLPGMRAGQRAYVAATLRWLRRRAAS
jgi:Phosphotransferase enzyme family